MSNEMSECVSMLVCWHFNFTIVILCTLPHIYNPPLPHTKATTRPLSHTYTHEILKFSQPASLTWACAGVCANMYPAYDSALADGGVSDGAHCAGLSTQKKTQTSGRVERYYPPLKKKIHSLGSFPSQKNHCVVTAFFLSFSTLYCVQHN
jgi:hypothetical protein